MKVEATVYGDRKVYAVSAFNRGVAAWLTRLPTLWVEGEVTELRRQERWQSVFFTLKDPRDNSCLPVTMVRRQFDALRLELENGERVHVYGRPELFEQRADFHLRALSIERFGLGEHLAALERLKKTLAAEGLFDLARKRPLARFPRRIGLVTGNDAAATLLAGKWIQGTTADENLAGLASLADISKMSESLLKPDGTVTKGPVTVYQGKKAIPLHDDGANPSTLYIAATGPPYPLGVVKDDTAAGAVRFSKYGKVHPPTPPARGHDQPATRNGSSHPAGGT